MNSREDIVGQSIICNGLGIGQIIEVGPLHEGGEEFYKVSFPKDKCINYFSTKNKSNYRVLSSEDVLNRAIEEFKSKHDALEYKTTQEKINTQRELLKEEDVIKLAKTLSILNDEKELHAQISKPFKDSLCTFIDEISFVLNVRQSEVYSMLDIKSPVKRGKR